MELAVELLAKKAARNAAKAAKLANSNASHGGNGVAATAAAAEPKSSRGKPAKAKQGKSSSRKPAAAAARSEARMGSGSKPQSTTGSREAAKGVTKRPAVKAAVSSRVKGSGTKLVAKADAAASKQPSAYQAYRSANWNGVKARHSALTGREVGAFKASSTCPDFVQTFLQQQACCLMPDARLLQLVATHSRQSLFGRPPLFYRSRYDFPKFWHAVVCGGEQGASSAVAGPDARAAG